MLGQFMATAVAGLCRQLKLAPALVGTSSDVRDLLAWKLGYGDCEREPLLSRGWRARVVGSLVDDLFSGRAALRIGDICSAEPLLIEQDGTGRPG